LTSIYELREVTHSYNGRPVLEIPDLKIEKGSIIGITGPNGSGKSTLLRILAFLENPQTGNLFFNGIPVSGPDEAYRRKATLLLQDPRLLKRSVFENIAYGLKTRGLYSGMKQKVHHALFRVGLDPGYFSGRTWFELSGGEAQRVALASRLILEPEALLLDEPTASIDAQSARLISKAIMETRRDFGTTVILVSHDFDWAYSSCDEVISMHSGVIHSRGPENILQGPWNRCSDNMVCMNLDDGQSITAPEPAFKPLFGLLDPEDIILSGVIPENISTRNVINGLVTRMNLEGRGSVLVSITAGGKTFISRVTHGSLDKMGLFPGSPVVLLFKATAIKWA